MPRRPTIPDLAEAAGVSVATVNRVLAGSDTVRERTMRRVLDAAERIDFYGRGAISARIDAARPRDRFVALLQQPGRTFYELIGRELRRAATEVAGRDVRLDVRFMEELSPERVAAEIAAAAEAAEAVAVVAADHPLIHDAVAGAVAGGTPVIGLITPLGGGAPSGFVGLDNYKVGRTAGWAFDRLCRRRGEIGMLVGSHRFRNQGLNEQGFRSYCREHAADLTILDPASTFEQAAVAHEVTERMLHRHPDLAGLYVSGGGVTGAIRALREAGPGKDGRGEDLVVVAYELFDATRAALIDGTLTLVIHHPIAALAEGTVAELIRAKAQGPDGSTRRTLLDFALYTSESV